MRYRMTLLALAFLPWTGCSGISANGPATHSVTRDSEPTSASPSQLAAREVIGVWIDESPIIAGRITLFRQNNRSYFEQTFFKDGTVYTTEIREVPSPLGRRFNKIETRAGDHWIIAPTGELLIRDNEGPIATARAAQANHPGAAGK